MHGHITGSEFAGWAGIAVIVAVAAGFALAALGSRRAARRLTAPGQAERWRRS